MCGRSAEKARRSVAAPGGSASLASGDQAYISFDKNKPPM